MAQEEGSLGKTGLVVTGRGLAGRQEVGGRIRRECVCIDGRRGEHEGRVQQEGELCMADHAELRKRDR